VTTSNRPDPISSASGVGRRTVAKFGAGGPDSQKVMPENVEAMRRAFEAVGVAFLMNGPHKGAIVPPKPATIRCSGADG